MQIFYSELSTNPKYLSFGYSIYGIIEDSDKIHEVYEKGFQPCHIIPGTTDMFYMARGTRVLVCEFKETSKNRRILRKFENNDASNIKITVHKKEEFPINSLFLDFCLTYFNFRHGSASMSKERLEQILNSQYLTHIVEYKINNKTAGYMLEGHGENYKHVFYLIYGKKFEGRHLGAYMMLDMVRRSKKENKQYSYLGVSYGDWMKYKTNYQPLEYWDGQTWVIDPKSKSLKELMRVDYLRTMTFTDLWRASRKSFYPAPISYTSDKQELRYLLLLAIRRPRLLLSLLIVMTTFLLFVLFKI